jgi:hypothetical protein
MSRMTPISSSIIPDTGDALSVGALRDTREPVGEVALEICRDPLEPTDRNRLFLDPAAPACGLAGPVADAPENTREDVGLPVHHVGLGHFSLGDQSNVFRDVRMSRTSPLAIDDPMEVRRVRGIGGLHSPLGVLFRIAAILQLRPLSPAVGGQA